MKEIWLINPYGPIEGENWREYSFNQFGKYLANKGFKTIWWTATFSHHFKRKRANGWKDINVSKYFTIRLVPTTSYKKNFGIGKIYKDFVFVKNLMKQFKHYNKPNLILAAENPLIMGKPAYAYSKKNDIPIIYDQMDFWPEFIAKSLKNPISKFMNILFNPYIKEEKKSPIIWIDRLR